MKKFILITLFVLPALFIKAQDLNQAVGLRGGLTSGFEYRSYTSEIHSVKILLGTNNGIRLHGLFEFHEPNLFLFTDQLTLFYGGGIHGGYENWDEQYIHGNASWYENRTAFVMGIDGIVGLEYNFIEMPLSVGIEAKPYIDIFGKDMFHFEPFDIAFTLKYLF